MASYPHNTASNTAKPWPAYFIVRTSGEVVPLIGVDELPIGTDLVGVPRALDLEDTIGMLNLGIQRSSEAFYQIAQQEKEVVAVDVATITKASKLRSSKPIAAEAQQQTVPTQTSTRPTHRCAASQPLPETQICRHWCTHGICKWSQKCHYRHIMPMTLPGLQAIGLNDWPAWYRALNPCYFANEATHLKPNFGRRGGRGRACGGNGCCGGLYLGASHVRAERLTAAAKAERMRKEELREQTLAKLRGLPKEMEKMKAVAAEKPVSGSVVLERAAVEDAKYWEDEGSWVAEESKEKIVEKVAKPSLLG